MNLGIFEDFEFGVDGKNMREFCSKRKLVGSGLECLGLLNIGKRRVIG